MTFEQAETLQTKFTPLIGKELNGKVISSLIVTPIDHHNLPEMIVNVGGQLTTNYENSRYAAFDVVVIYDYDKWIETGSLDWDAIPLVSEELELMLAGLS